ncbi:MAG: hypothetical protein LBP59_08545 [Planctomycetaceae bacterium]|jgi:hypothetical protein|nr:hypothetical protein [Planctomycetaceae bacterium]
MYNFYKTILISFLIILFCGNFNLYSDELPQNDTTMSAATLLDAMKESISQIRSIEVPYKVYNLIDDGKSPDVEKDDNGYLVFDYLQWGYQASNNKEYHIVRNYLRLNNSAGKYEGWYEKSSATYNGDLFSSYNFTKQSGAIRFDKEYFEPHHSPITLWGKNFSAFGVFPDLRLIDIFSKAEIVEDKELPSHIKKLSLFKPDEDEKMPPDILSIWIDMKRGFMPIKFQLCTNFPSELFFPRIEIMDMLEPLPGIWIPISGRLLMQFTTNEMIIEGGLTQEEWENKNKSLSTQELIKKIKSEVRYKLDTVDRLIVFDTKNLVLNKKIPDDKFVYKFKHGDKIWNDLKQRSEIVGVDDSTVGKVQVDTSKLSTNINWRFLFGGLGFLIVVFTLFVATRKSRKA